MVLNYLISYNKLEEDMRTPLYIILCSIFEAIILVDLALFAYALRKITVTVRRTQFTEMKLCSIVLHWTIMLTTILALILNEYFNVVNDPMKPYRFYISWSLTVNFYMILQDLSSLFILVVMHMMIRPPTKGSESNKIKSMVFLDESQVEELFGGALSQMKMEQ